MKRFVIFAVGFMLSAASVAAPKMTPGLWEMTMTMEGAGMPMSMPATTFKHCYKAEDLKDLRKTVPERNSSCKVSDWKESGDTVTWKMSCTGSNAMTGAGRITYAGDTYQGENQVTMTQGGQTITMTQKYTARRIGDCR